MSTMARAENPHHCIHRAPVDKLRMLIRRRRRRKWCRRYQRTHLDSLDPRHIKGGSLTATGLMTACE